MHGFIVFLRINLAHIFCHHNNGTIDPVTVKYSGRIAASVVLPSNEAHLSVSGNLECNSCPYP